MIARVTENDIMKMKELGDRIKGESSDPVEVDIFIVAVPAFGPESVVNNMFGIITGNKHLDRKFFLKKFKNIGEQEGLLPKQDKK